MERNHSFGVLPLHVYDQLLMEDFTVLKLSSQPVPWEMGDEAGLGTAWGLEAQLLGRVHTQNIVQFGESGMENEELWSQTCSNTHKQT